MILEIVKITLIFIGLIVGICVIKLLDIFYTSEIDVVYKLLSFVFVIAFFIWFLYFSPKRS